MLGEAYSWGMGCGRFSGLSARGLMVWVVVCCLSCGAMAQGIAGSVNAVLPDAPAPVGDAQASGAQGVGVIAGTVTDSDGALVAGAHVTLTGDAVKGERTAVSDGAGRFRFEGVAAGEFRLTVTAKGLAMGEAGGTLQPGAVYEAAAISLRVATANSEVDVSPGAQRAIAEEEVKTEEKQRVLAIVPNCFVTYDKNPMPLDAKQKFDLGWHVVLDPTHFLFSAVARVSSRRMIRFRGLDRMRRGMGSGMGRI
jgi:hypothetical protein